MILIKTMDYKTICPYCGYKSTNHETLEGKNKPKNGEISFCMNCGEVSKFTKKELVKVNIEELKYCTREEINDIRVAWLRRKAIENLK
jgi:uncharacterized Zn finger protein